MAFSNNKTISDFPFVFNCNNIGSLVNYDLIKPLERIKNTSPIPAMKILGVLGMYRIPKKSDSRIPDIRLAGYSKF